MILPTKQQLKPECGNAIINKIIFTIISQHESKSAIGQQLIQIVACHAF